MLDELGRAQERLGRTLARARASEDRELAARVREEGFQLVHLLNGVMHMSRLHSADNRAFDQPMRDLEHTFQRLMELLGPIHLVCVEDQVYLNEIRIRGDERGEASRALGAELRRHGVGGLRFYDEPGEPQLRRLVACFARRPADGQPRAALREALAAEGLGGVEAAGLFRFRTSDERPAESSRDVGDVVTRAADAVADAWENLGRKRMPNPLPLRRAITEILSVGPAHQAFWSVPDADRPHAAHGLRVACLSLVIGQQIGLSDGALQDLGVAALLHDVGYAAREGGDGGPSAGAPPPFERHAAAGVRLILRQRGFHEAKLRRARAVLQHHRDASDPRRPALFARILRVAEDYDTLVRSGGGRMSPPEALGRIVAGAGHAYDASLAAALANALGLWPPGTPLTLEDGRQVRVVMPAVDAAHFDRPIVALERLADGRPAPPGDRLDLARLGLRVREDEARAVAPSYAALESITWPQAAPAEAALELGDSDEVAPLPFTSEGEVMPAVVPAVLGGLHVGRHTGLLLLQAGAEQRRLRFAEGRLVHVTSSRAEHQLEAVLLAHGLVRPLEAQRAKHEAAAHGQPLGRRLQAQGLISASRLQAALVAQARLVLTDLARWDDGDYVFGPHERVREDEDLAEAGLPTADLIFDVVRAIEDPDVVRFALGDLDRVVTPTPAAREAGALRLSALDKALLAAADGRSTARQVLSRARDSEQAQRSLLGLISTGLVAVA